MKDFLIEKVETEDAWPVIFMFHDTPMIAAPGGRSVESPTKELSYVRYVRLYSLDNKETRETKLRQWAGVPDTLSGYLEKDGKV